MQLSSRQNGGVATLRELAAPIGCEYLNKSMAHFGCLISTRKQTDEKRLTFIQPKLVKSSLMISATPCSDWSIAFQLGPVPLNQSADAAGPGETETFGYRQVQNPRLAIDCLEGGEG
jgi:hypothetical protein